MTKLRTTALTFATLAFLAAGLGTTARVAAKDPGGPEKAAGVKNEVPATLPAKEATAPAKSPEEPGREAWSLPLRTAIRVGLENSSGVKVGLSPAAVVDGNAFSIWPSRADVEDPAFKVEAMALVRTIEQQYWMLGQQHVRLWAAEKAVELAEEVIRGEAVKRTVRGQRGAELDQARNRLDALRLHLVHATSDVITAERYLRKILGLPATDDRRLVPATAPSEARSEPDWDDCRAEMMLKHPFVAQAKEKVQQVEATERTSLVDEAAGTFLPDVAGGRTPRRVQSAVLRSRAHLEEVVRRSTHSMARYFLEIDVNYKQFQTAVKFRNAAAARLDQEAERFEKGQGSILSYFDAVRDYTTAVNQEAQWKASYNISLMALEEAKGTLLDHYNIMVMVLPRSSTDPAAQRGSTVTSALAGVPAQSPSPSVPRTTDSKEGDDAKAKDSRDGGAGKTFSFHVTIGSGPRPVEVRGAFTIGPARTDAGEVSP